MPNIVWVDMRKVDRVYVIEDVIYAPSDEVFDELPEALKTYLDSLITVTVVNSTPKTTPKKG